MLQRITFRRLFFTSLVFLVSGCFLTAASISIAAQTGDQESPLELKIIAPLKVCAGEKFKLKARLKNNTDRVVVVDSKGIWRSLVERGPGEQASSDGFSSQLRTRRIRITTGNGVSDANEKKRFINLKPGSEYTTELPLNRSKDKFYRTIGDYSVTTTYMAQKDLGINPADLFTEPVMSLEFTFAVVKCAGSRMPARY